MGAFHVLDRGSSPRIGNHPFCLPPASPDLLLTKGYLLGQSGAPGDQWLLRKSHFPFCWWDFSHPSPGFESPYRNHPFCLPLPPLTFS